jgi:predicted outer membrane repeat protein
MGLALTLPWLANAQGLAADEKPNEPPDFAKVVHSAELAYALAANGNGNAPTALGLCFATYNDGTNVFSSFDASAVQQAVEAASSGGKVKVAGSCVGIQERSGLNQTVYISKSLTLEGGHTQSDWNLEPDLNTYVTLLYADHSGRVVVISGTQGVTLASLFLAGGLAEDGTLDDNGGGIWSNSEFTLTNSIIYSNTAPLWFGGGMYNLDISPILTNVVFSGNSAPIGGAMYNNGRINGNSNPTLTNVTFTGNSAGEDGGAMYNNGSFSGTSSPTLTNVTFSGNSAGDSGGAMYNDGYSSGNSNPTLTNVTFTGNSAGEDGGAMYNDGYSSGNSNPTLTNVTFSGNSAYLDGGAMFNDGRSSGTSSTKVYNSILWNNQANGVTGTITANIFNNSASISLTHSLLEGSGGSGSGTWPPSYVDGGDNIDTDPLFILDVNPSTAPTITGNLRLQAGSPAIDVGNNSFIAGVSTDLDGEARIKDGDGDGTETVDMGAYEAKGYYQLSVTKTGAGSGQVTSSPAGIDCGDTCSVYLQEDSTITLTAIPDEGSTFSGWSGDCSGTEDCVVQMVAAKTVTATSMPAHCH